MRLVSAWGSGENPSDSNGKRPLQDVTGGQPMSGARSTAMGQKPRELGQTGTWGGGARPLLRGDGLALIPERRFSEPDSDLRHLDAASWSVPRPSPMPAGGEG